MSALVNIVSHIHYVSISACGRRRRSMFRTRLHGNHLFRSTTPESRVNMPGKEEEGSGSSAKGSSWSCELRINAR